MHIFYSTTNIKLIFKSYTNLCLRHKNLTKSIDNKYRLIYNVLGVLECLFVYFVGAICKVFQHNAGAFIYLN